MTSLVARSAASTVFGKSRFGKPCPHTRTPPMAPLVSGPSLLLKCTVLPVVMPDQV